MKTETTIFTIVALVEKHVTRNCRKIIIVSFFVTAKKTLDAVRNSDRMNMNVLEESIMLEGLSKIVLSCTASNVSRLMTPRKHYIVKKQSMSSIMVCKIDINKLYIVNRTSIFRGKDMSRNYSAAKPGVNKKETCFTHMIVYLIKSQMASAHRYVNDSYSVLGFIRYP